MVGKRLAACEQGVYVIKSDDLGVGVEDGGRVFDEGVFTGVEDDGLVAVGTKSGQVDHDEVGRRIGKDNPEVWSRTARFGSGDQEGRAGKHLATRGEKVLGGGDSFEFVGEAVGFFR